MRLLNTETYKPVDNPEGEYTILCHRWIHRPDDGVEEVTHRAASALQYPSQAKPELALALNRVRGACAPSRNQQNLKWLWVDTFCIDKTSSQELT